MSEKILLAARAVGNYNAADAAWMSIMLDQPRHTDKQLRTIWKVLRKYRGQLSQGGIEYDELTPPGLPPRDGRGRFQIPEGTVRFEWVETEDGYRIAILFSENVELQRVTKSLSKRSLKKLPDGRKAWVIPDDLGHFQKATEAFGETDPPVSVEVAPELATRIQAKIDEREQAYRDSRAADADLEVPTKRPLLPFQRAGVKWIRDRKGRALIGDEMGLGKTAQVIGYFTIAPEALPALVVCPANVRASWVREVAKWSDLRTLLVVQKALVKGLRDLGLEVSERPLPGYDVTVVNYDLSRATVSGKYKRMTSALLAGIPLEDWKGFNTLVFDESHYIKERSSQRTRVGLALASHVPLVDIKSWPTERVIALTGTPLVNRPKDLWTQLRAVAWWIFPQFLPYAKRFCAAHPKYHKGWDYSGASNLEELEKILRSTVMLRRTKKQVLPELPGKTRVTLPIALNLKEYRAQLGEILEGLGEMKRKKDAWKELLEEMSEEERKSYLAEHAEEAAGAAKLDGYMIREIDRIKWAAFEAKFNATVQFIVDAQSQQGKVLVFAAHHEAIDRIVEHCRQAGVKVDSVDGRVTGAARERVLSAFQDGDLEVLVGGIRAIAEGLTLTASHTVITVEFDWNPSKHDQAEARCDRIGQKSLVTAYYLVALGTIEEKIAALIDSKREVSNVTMGEGERTLEEGGILDAIVEELLG
jgi:SWI/SNF-related matrix-associated actin-dependent regulator 1 of chromatin subfamily A